MTPVALDWQREQIQNNQIEDDLHNIAWLLWHYCRLSSNGKQRARAIFRLLAALGEGEG